MTHENVNALTDEVAVDEAVTVVEPEVPLGVNPVPCAETAVLPHAYEIEIGLPCVAIVGWHESCTAEDDEHCQLLVHPFAAYVGCHVPLQPTVGCVGGCAHATPSLPTPYGFGCGLHAEVDPELAQPYVHACTVVIWHRVDSHIRVFPEHMYC